MDDARQKTTLGDRVRHHRLMRGMSLRLLADLAGISAGWLSRVFMVGRGFLAR